MTTTKKPNITDNEAEAIQHACEWLDLSFRRSYSGRCMYGRTCIGVTHRYATDIVDLVEELRDNGEEALARKLRKGGVQDSMGLRTITYWPHLHCDVEDDVEDDGDE